LLLHLPSISQWAGGRASVRRFFLVAALVAAMGASAAADEQTTVSEAGGVYTVRASFTVVQSPAAAMAVLTDYEHLSRFMPGLQSSTVIGRDGSRVTISQEAVAKFLAFSKQISLVLDVDERPLSLAFADRAHKSFSHYQGTWQISTLNGRTLVTYTLAAKPSFSVPEFILSKLFKRDAGRMIAALQAEISSRLLD
jgi:ribosome-associated toxin RatA of RatAB toxin-antitoxin module